MLRPAASATRTAVAALVLVLAVASGMATPRTASAQPVPPGHLPPVDGPVVDPFRPPDGPYGAGNRGLEYDTAPGTPVRATAEGEVTFAGAVAGTLHVTVLHADGIRTSYSFLQRIDVAVGQTVRQGHVLGLAGDRLHLGARLGDAYLDPASLFGAGAPHVRLVPFDDPPLPGPAGERSAIRQLIGGAGDLAGSAADWLRGGVGLAGDAVRHVLERANPAAHLRGPLELVDAVLTAWDRSHRPCTAADAAVPPPPPGRRIALLVGGLGSTSDNAAIDDVDVLALGYADRDVLRFSYAGGRTPDPTDGLSEIEAHDYDAVATQADLHHSAAALADLVDDVVAAADGAVVDLLAHSQGGLVTRLALAELERRHGASWSEHVGLVATLGTPHSGADLATAMAAVRSRAAGAAGLDALGAVVPFDIDPGSTSVGQLAETSAVIDQLESTPFPEEVDAVSIAARLDAIVPVPRAEAPGAVQVVVEAGGLATAHDQLPGSQAATRELGLALAGAPPTCESFGEAVGDQLFGRTISAAEDAAGALGWALTTAPG